MRLVRPTTLAQGLGQGGAGRFIKRIERDKPVQMSNAQGAFGLVRLLTRKAERQVPEIVPLGGQPGHLFGPVWQVCIFQQFAAHAA